MKISAQINSKKDNHQIKVDSGGIIKELSIGSGINGFGSSINGGEFLFLAIATCFCNDIYREAKKKDIIIENVLVEATGEFSKEGAPGYNIEYKAEIKGNASEDILNQLIKDTDKVAEIHNTLRKGVDVMLINN